MERNAVIKVLAICLLTFYVLPVSYCQSVKFYKLYIGPWGVPPQDYINLDVPGLDEIVRQHLRAAVEFALHASVVAVLPENAELYNWISSLGSDRFNILYNGKYYRVLIVSEVERPVDTEKTWVVVFGVETIIIIVLLAYIFVKSRKKPVAHL